MYDREATPFVPDYKFLSNVLETRQTRYDQNYKAINDAYSKVVFADLSREENQEKREQFTKQIAPKMAQISGYDLSLRQNADMASGVFAPFYEDDAIVRDLTNTANYKFGKRYANSLANSMDKDQRDMWWQVGVDHLDMQMEKYMTASAEDAANIGIGNYTANPNLYEYSLELLDEQGFEVEKDIPTKDGKWIIRQKNGDLVTDTAYAYLNKALMDDPRVIKGYQVKSQVDAYNFAKQGVESGQYANFAQAEEFWARDTIEQITTQAAMQLGEDKAKAEELGEAAARWQEYNNQYNFPEGHSSEKIASDWKAKYRAQVRGVEAKRDIINQGIGAESSANTDLMNKAFMMYMGVNIQDDLASAAKSYSMKDFSMQINDNPYGLAKYKAELKSALQKEKARLDYEATLEERAYADQLANRTANELLISDGGAGNINISKITKNGVVESTAPTLKENEVTRKAFLNGIKSDEVGFVLDYHKFAEGLKAEGDGANIVIDGNSMNLTQARTFLARPENERHLSKLYNAASSTVKDENSYPEGSLGAHNEEMLRRLRQVPNDLVKRQNRDLTLKDMEFEAAYNNYQTLLTMEKSYGKDLIKLRKLGIPDIFGGDVRASEGNTGKPATSILSKAEYIEEYTKWAQANDQHYSSAPLVTAVSASPTRAAGSIPMMNPAYTAKIVGNVANWFRGDDNQIDMSATNNATRRQFRPETAKKQAEKIYDEQAKYINATLNGAIDVHQNEKGGDSFESPFTRFSYAEGSIGISPDQMTGASASMTSGVKNQFNPQSTSSMSPEYYDFKTLINEINQNTGVVSIIQGNVMEQENMSMEINNTSKQLLTALASKTTQWMNAPRDSNGNIKTTGLGDNPTFDIQYNPIMGGANDTEKQAGYVINMNNDFVGEYLKNSGYEADDINDFISAGGSEISVVIDKRMDMNKRSMNNIQAAVSDVNASINLSGTNYYENDTYKQGGGYLKVYREGTSYFYEFQGKTFNSDTGEFEVNQKGSAVPIPIQNLNELDGYVNSLELDLYNLNERNSKAREAYLERIKK